MAYHNEVSLPKIHAPIYVIRPIALSVTSIPKAKFEAMSTLGPGSHLEKKMES